MEVDGKYRQSLCPLCQSMLSKEPTRFLIPAQGQTFHVFKDAVDKRCIICSFLWSMTSEYHHIWIESPQHWKPVNFLVHSNGISASGVKFADLSVFYKTPFTGLEKSIIFSLYPWSAIIKQLYVQFLKPRLDIEDVITLGSSWLTECQSSHPRCDIAHRPAPGWLPTRLLDIGEEPLNTWKVCVTAQDKTPAHQAPYIALSYRWGSTAGICLLSSNLERFRHSQSITHLPILFRDVINVARRFAIRYLWIDALCIMQDSTEDWEREAPTMQHVYSNSVFTIAATGSESPDDTLLHARDLDLVKIGKVQCSLFSDEPQPCIIYDSAYWERHLGEGPLYNRGWAFQERVLSPRVMHFGRHQMLWECRSRHRCEAFPEGIPDRKPTKELDTLMEVQDNTPMTDDLARLWCCLVEEYCECSLTFPSDKLHAMAGIAKLFETVTGDEYVAGLWRSRFIELLQWSAYEVKPLQSTDYRAPSWSWASIDSDIWYWTRSSRATNLAHLVDISVLNQTSDRMSTVLSACAVVSARVIPAVCKSVAMEGVTFVTFRCHNNEFKVDVDPDTTNGELIAGNEYAYMPLLLDYNSSAADNSSMGRTGFCLILERDKQSIGGLDRYRRLGSFRVEEEYSDNVEDIFCCTEFTEIEMI